MDRPELRLSGALGLSESSGFGCRTGGLSGKGVVATRVFTGRRGSGARRERGGVAATSRSAFKSRGGHDVFLGVRHGAAAAADPARRGTQPRSGRRRSAAVSPRPAAARSRAVAVTMLSWASVLARLLRLIPLGAGHSRAPRTPRQLSPTLRQERATHARGRVVGCGRAACRFCVSSPLCGVLIRRPPRRDRSSARQPVQNTAERGRNAEQPGVIWDCGGQRARRPFRPPSPAKYCSTIRIKSNGDGRTPLPPLGAPEDFSPRASAPVRNRWRPRGNCLAMRRREGAAANALRSVL